MSSQIPLRDSEIAKAFRSRPFQKEGCLFAARNRRVLIADEPGLGKSLQSIAAVVQSGCTGSVLVVAPKTAVYVTWPAELKRWIADVAPDDRVVIVGGQADKLERLKLVRDILQWEVNHQGTARQWILVSPNYLRFKYQVDDKGHYVYDKGKKIPLAVNEAIKPFLAIKWAAVIVDEAHQTLAGDTGNEKTGSAQSGGLRMLDYKPDGLRLALSGTPFRGKHENIWGILNWLYPKDYPSYWNWTKKHFFQFLDPRLGTVVLSDIKSEEAMYKELKDIMIRRTKGEVVKDLPPKSYGGTPLYKDGPVAVWLDMHPQQRKAYEEMVDLAMAKIEGGTLMANGVLAEMIRLKQFSNSLGFLDEKMNFWPKLPSNKYDWLAEFLKERGIDGKGPGDSKVLVASQFTRHIDMFAHHLNKAGISTFSLTGKTSAEDRKRYQEAFQSNSMKPLGKKGPAPDVFLLNTKAGGVAITLDVADDVVLLDRTFNHDDQEQVEDRAHRISNMHNVSIWNLVSRNSIEEKIIRTTHETNLSIKQILDGERGIEFAMQLLEAC